MPDPIPTAAIADHLFTGGPDDPRLIGSRCPACHVMTFPVQNSCPRCGRSPLEPTEYHRTGTLWTYTVQNFPPKSPPYAFPPSGNFTPYAVGYVRFEGQGLVEGRIECADPGELTIGMGMRVGLSAFGDGTPESARWIHCFVPADEQEA